MSPLMLPPPMLDDMLPLMLPAPALKKKREDFKCLSLTKPTTKLDFSGLSKKLKNLQQK